MQVFILILPFVRSHPLPLFIRPGKISADIRVLRLFARRESERNRRTRLRFVTSTPLPSGPRGTKSTLPVPPRKGKMKIGEDIQADYDEKSHPISRRRKAPIQDRIEIQNHTDQPLHGESHDEDQQVQQR